MQDVAVKRRNNPVSGMNYFLRGLSLMMKPGVKRWAMIPLVINILIFSVGIYVGWQQLDNLSAWFDNNLHEWLTWLKWLLWPLFIVSASLLVFFGFSVIGNFIASPFNGMLAAAVEQHLTGQSSEAGGLKGFAIDIAKSLYSELRKLVYFVLWAIPLLLLTLFPLTAPVGSILWILFGAWMMCISYADFPMANHGLTFPRQRKVLRKRRMLSLGFGGTATLALMIPFVNFIVIPAAVAGATAMWVEQLAAEADNI